MPQRLAGPNAAGRVSPHFRWADATRTDSPAAVLATEGLRFDDGAATRETCLSLDELRGMAGD